MNRRFTDWGAPLPPLSPEEQAKRDQETEEVFDPGGYLFGTGVPAKWATSYEIAESNDLFHKAGERMGVVVGYELNCGIDYRSILGN